jgi:antitoxin PrlF
MLISTLTSKGQTTLPREVREALGLKPGDKLAYRVEGETVRLTRPRSLIELAGCLADAYQGPPVSVEEMDEAVAEAAAERFRRSVER